MLNNAAVNVAYAQIQKTVNKVNHKGMRVLYSHSLKFNGAWLMEEKAKLTATHIRYLLVLKKLNKDIGIKSVDVAKTMKITKASVSNMMNFFIHAGYIKKELGGLVYMTEIRNEYC